MGTADIIICLVVIVLFIAFLLFIVAPCDRESKDMNEYISKNIYKLLDVERKLLKCDDLDEFGLIKRLAIATAENFRNKLMDMYGELGWNQGEFYVRKMKRLISIKEEELINKKLESTEKEIMNKR